MKTIRLVLLGAFAATLVGCAGVNTTSRVRPPERAGLPARGDYRAMLIDPIVFGPAAAMRLKPSELNRLSEAFLRRARDTFAIRYALVDAPDSGVLRLRLVVDDIDKSSRGANLLSAALVFVPLDTGAVAAEMIVEDSVTGVRVAALTGKRQGSPLGRGGFFASFKPTGHAQAGFDQLLQELLKLLTESAPDAADKKAEAPRLPPPLP